MGTISGRVSVSHRQILRYRRNVLANYAIRTKRQALGFVEKIGFCYAFTAGPGELPGLFDVLATRSVDRMWTWAWRWKDELPSERKVFYGKVFHRKPTYISLEYLPHFYALTDNVGAPDDYLQAYGVGRLSTLAKDLCEYLKDHGASSTWLLRKEFVRHRERSAAFHRALNDLQGRFLIVKVDESERGSYSFIWDLFDRWLPQIPDRAGKLSTDEAAAAVLERYLQTVGAVPVATLASLFGWSPTLIQRAQGRLAGRVLEGELDGSPVLLNATLVESP